MSEADEYDRLMSVFEELREADPRERALQLDLLRSEAEPGWVEMLEELLKIDAEGDSPLEQGAPLTDLSEEGLGSSFPPRAEARPLPAELGETVGAYRLTDIIGRGGMGCVYRATHVELGRVAAVKVLEPELAEDESYVSRFLHEAKIVNAVRHANLVDIIDFIDARAPRRVALVMELLKGHPLGQYIRTIGLSLDETVGATLQLSGALAAVHAQEIVHRDLKPDNVMVVGPLGSGPRAPPGLKLLDFGIAKVSDPLALHRTASGTFLGTPAYMAPEQFSAEPITPACDVYALAELVYEMLAGRPLFEGRGLAMIRGKMAGLPDSLELPEELPHSGAVRDLLHDCLQVRPHLRPTVLEFERRLESIYPEAVKVWRGRGKDAQRESSKRGQTAWSVGLGLTALLVSGIGARALISSPPPSSVTELYPDADPSAGHATTALGPPAIVYAEGDEALYRVSASMGNFAALEIDEAWSDNPASGEKCVRLYYRDSTGWAGAAWLDPPRDWGRIPGGYGFPGARQLSFWARGAAGGERLVFGYGLILRTQPYFDTARDSVEVVLRRSWQRYVIDLEGRNLERIKVGFFAVVGNSDAPIEIFVDDIVYR
ncbi:MAG: serine/threonine-protein kinase [Myxococcota bacterium]